MQTPRSMTLQALSLLLPLLLMVGFGPAPAAAAATRKRTVTIFQDAPTITTIIDGNLTTYQYFADLRTAAGGPLVGRLYGQTAFNEALFANAQIEARWRSLVFDFIGTPATQKIAPTGQISANGIVSYVDNSFFLQVGRPVVIPVTGGSLGWYGATGQVTSTRLNAQNEHEHTFEVRTINYKPPRKA